MVDPRTGFPWASKSVHTQRNPSSIYLSYASYCIVSYSSVLPLSPLFFPLLHCSVPLALLYLSQMMHCQKIKNQVFQQEAECNAADLHAEIIMGGNCRQGLQM